MRHVNTVARQSEDDERITCRAAVLVDQFRRENCVQEYEGLGFVQAQNLTPEQRDNHTAETDTVKHISGLRTLKDHKSF